MLIFLTCLIIGIVLLSSAKNNPTAEIDDYIHGSDDFSDRISKLIESNPRRADTELLVAVCELLAQNLQMQKIIAENAQRTSDALHTFMRLAGAVFILGGFAYLVNSFISIL